MVQSWFEVVGAKIAIGTCHVIPRKNSKADVATTTTILQSIRETCKTTKFADVF